MIHHRARTWNSLLVLCILGLAVQGSSGAACRARGSDSANGGSATPAPDAARSADEIPATDVAAENGGDAAALPFSDVTEGLAPQHLEQLPYWETRFCTPPVERPGRTVCNLQRLYGDGAYYRMNDDQPVEGAPRWHFLTTVRSEAFPELDRLFADLCALDRPIPAGEAVWGEVRVNAPSCTRLFRETTEPSPLEEARTILFRHFETIPPGEPHPAASGGTDSP